MKIVLQAILLLGLIFATHDIHADGEQLGIRLLSVDAGAPQSPRNIKLVMQLPQQYRDHDFQKDEILFFVYPKELSASKGAVRKYLARGEIFWRRGDLLFVDIRKLPLQNKAGEYSVIGLIVNKNNNTVACSAVAPGTVIYESPDVDVALVIDCSQSMAKNDPHKKRLAAASAFIEMATRHGRISSVGIVKFNDAPTLVSEFLPLRNSTELLKRKLKTIGSSGQTNIGLAIDEVVELTESNNKRKAVVFLTDGKNESVAYDDEHLKLAANDVPVYCIGLSGEADMAMLKRIASETGGRAYQAANYRELMSLYQRIAAEIGQRKEITTRAVLNDEEVINIPVDSTVNNISVTTDAGLAQCDIEVVSPQGKVIVDNYNSADYQQLRIEKPTVGDWEIKVRKKVNLSVVNVVISADTSLFIDTFPPLDNGKEYLLAATLADGEKKISKSKISFINGIANSKVQFIDNGKHYDGKADDGLYVAAISKDRKLNSRLVLSASGQYKGNYLRQTDAGMIVCDKAAYIKPVTVYGAIMDFGELYPGESVKLKYHIRHQGAGCNVSFDISDFMTEEGKKLSSFELKYKPEYDIKDGDNVVDLALKIHDKASVGLYKCLVVWGDGKKKTEVPAVVRVCSYELKALRGSINAGMFLPGEALRFEIPLKFKGYKPLLPQVGCDKKWLSVKQVSGLLKPGREQLMVLEAMIDADAKAGIHKVKVAIGLGNDKKEIELQFEIPEQGVVQESLIAGHELKMPAAGMNKRVMAFVHETKLHADAKAVIVKLKKVVDKPALTALVKENVKLPQEKFPLPLLLIGVAVFIAILLLILRNMSNSRAVRFLFLSIAVHLPLVAFLAVYVMSVNDSAIVTEKPQTMAIALSKDSSSKNSTVGSKNDNGVLRSTSGVALDSESRFKSRGDFRGNKPTLPERRRSVSKSVMPKNRAMTKSNTAIELEKSDLRTERIVRESNSKPERSNDVTKPRVVASSAQKRRRKVNDANSSKVSELQSRFNVGKDVGAIVGKTVRVKPESQLTINNTKHETIIKLSEQKDEVHKPKLTIAATKKQHPEFEAQLPVSVTLVKKRSEASEMVAPLIRTTKIGKSQSLKNSETRKDYLPENNELLANLNTNFKGQNNQSVDRGFSKTLKRDDFVPEVSVKVIDKTINLRNKKGLELKGGVSAVAIVSGIKEIRQSENSQIAKSDESKLTSVGVVKSLSIVKMSDGACTVAGQKCKDYAAAQMKNSGKPVLDNRESITVNNYAVSPVKKDCSIKYKRFGEGGYSAMAMSAPDGGMSRIEKTSIRFSDRQPMVKKQAQGIGKISKMSTKDAASKDVVSSKADAVCINVGVVGTLGYKLPELQLRNVSFEVRNVALRENNIAEQQVLIVGGDKLLSQEHIKMLTMYVLDGGKVWLRERADLLALKQSIDKCNSGNAQAPIYSKSKEWEKVVTKTGVALVALSSELSAEKQSEKVMKEFFKTDVLLSTNIRSSGKSVMWQDYSALANNKHGWRVAKWGDKAKVSLVPDGRAGMSMLVAVSENVKGKTGISYSVPDYNDRRLDLSKYKQALVDLYSASDEPVKVSLLFTCFSKTKGWEEYETSSVRLSKGWNRNTEFDLNNLLSRTSGRSAYDADFDGADQCARITILLRSSNKIKLLVDNFRWAY